MEEETIITKVRVANSNGFRGRKPSAEERKGEPEHLVLCLFLTALSPTVTPAFSDRDVVGRLDGPVLN